MNSDMQCPYADNCENFQNKCWKCSGFMYYSKIKTKKPTIRRSRRQGVETEHMVARMQPNSGATKYENYKNDIIMGPLSIECKETGKKSISIKKKDLEKTAYFAKKQNKMPVYIFRYKEDINNKLYAVVDYDDLLALVGKEE